MHFFLAIALYILSRYIRRTPATPHMHLMTDVLAYTRKIDSVGEIVDGMVKCVIKICSLLDFGDFPMLDDFMDKLLPLVSRGGVDRSTVWYYYCTVPE